MISRLIGIRVPNSAACCGLARDLTVGEVAKGPIQTVNFPARACNDGWESPQMDVRNRFTVRNCTRKDIVGGRDLRS